MNELIKEYLEKFDENFPVFMVMGMSKKEIMNLIKKSIKENKPYEPDIVENAIY